MSAGIFVRQCPVCTKLHQTHDQLGKTPCGDKCTKKAAERAAAKAKGQPTPPAPAPEPSYEDEEPETVDDLLPPS